MRCVSAAPAAHDIERIQSPGESDRGIQRVHAGVSGISTFDDCDPALDPMLQLLGDAAVFQTGFQLG